MKKIFLVIALACVTFSIAPLALADDTSGFVALAPITGLTDQSPTSVVNAETLATFFNALYMYLIGIAATLAVIEIIWGGLEISTKDSVSKQSDGKKRITQAIFGLILVLSPVVVFSLINPSILNLSLNLPALNTVTPNSNSNTANANAIPPGGNPSMNQLSEADQQACAGYSKFQQVASSNGCQSLGDNWALVENVCMDTVHAGNVACGLHNTEADTQAAADTCAVQGTAGILQIANCPSSTAAQAWVQNCTAGNGVFDPLATNTNGGAASFVALCGTNEAFTFVDTSSLLLPKTISDLQPIGPEGAKAMQYANICKTGIPGVSYSICTMSVNKGSDKTDCPALTNAPPNYDTATCYKKSLVCGNNSNLILWCSSSPNWTLYQ